MDVVTQCLRHALAFRARAAAETDPDRKAQHLRMEAACMEEARVAAALDYPGDDIR